MTKKKTFSIQNGIDTLLSLFLITVFWLVLMGDITVQNILLGVIISITALLFTNLVILDKKDYSKQFRMPFVTVLKYSVYLVYQIYAAGFAAMKKVLSRKVHVSIVEITTELSDGFSIALLANSITLTPGTVTLDKTGQSLKIIWLTDNEEDLLTRNLLIKGHFEEIISERNAK